jgi:hypothetical protein
MVELNERKGGSTPVQPSRRTVELERSSDRSAVEVLRQAQVNRQTHSACQYARGSSVLIDEPNVRFALHSGGLHNFF